MKLKRVGNYKELKHGDKQGESLYELMSAVPCLNEDKIISYLKSGRVFCASASLVYDVLSKDEIIIDELYILTDGVWSWSSDLAYYIKKYHIDIDKNFICHMENNAWTINRDVIDLAELERRNFPRQHSDV